MRTPLDEFAKLLENPSHDLSVDVYNGNKKIKEPSVKKHRNGRMTLDKLAVTVNNLSMTVNDLAKEMRNGFKQVNNRIDNLENDVNSFKQEVNARLDNIEKRLDYNNLKQLPK